MPATAYEIPHLTVEDFLGLPVRIGASISPDGTRIAYLAPWRNRLNVWVTGIGTGEQPRRVTAEALRSVRTYHWTDDPRWLLYEQDRDGDENWRIYRVDLENPDAEAVELTPFPGVRAMGLEMPVTWPGRAILRLNGRDPAEFDLYTLDIATGELTMLARNPGLVADLICTPDGDVCALALTADGYIELSQWDVGTGALRRVRTFDGADHPMGVRPFQLTPDGTGAWIGSSRGSDRTRLVRLDLTTGAETEVDSHPAHDLDTRSAVHPEVPSPLIIDRCTGDLIGVRYLGERQVIHPLDPHFAAVLENLEQLSDGDLAAVSSDVCGQRWVVSFTHDRAPGITYYYNHSTGESRMLFRPYPHLDPDFLAPMTPVTIPARDGLDLPSYLTLPVGTDPTGLPLVLLVHGGPWTRDGWGFHPVVQLPANRGYAVLQADFRGSTGHGKAHLKAGIGELAGKMHHDLLDAVDWAVKEGFADRDRVAIVGCSYGGYAALVGAAFTPTSSRPRSTSAARPTSSPSCARRRTSRSRTC
ncbi:prolyl oligopeptidase family serine peptidase [Streptomyces sp. NBS 14/10]|uniref:S9 family peptidase n=1 Tax=Streptomyces sp. NBS 14/10 TaxID=1945643 RepID=UPI00211B5E97|nr:alpha/beta fold hydrolase [Streptomyces sp. NBS 14/10]KAK1183479.1 prolyl oligopeptidase family serine peptidase [Streptomyces sp. NBS 14/10]